MQLPAHARQGAPDTSGMAEMARKREADSLKGTYGFTEGQIKKYFVKEEKINKDIQTQGLALRKKLAATHDKEQRSKIIRQMLELNNSSTSKYMSALLSIATPTQQKKIKAQQKN